MNQVYKRMFTRIEFSRKVSIHFQKNSYGPCSIRNLSLGGMFVVGDFEEDVGAICHLVFMQTGASSELTIRASAKVIRAGSDGIALEFTSMSNDSYMFLQTSLLYQADDPLPISLEFPDETPYKLTEIVKISSEQNKVFL